MPELAPFDWLTVIKGLFKGDPSNGQVESTSGHFALRTHIGNVRSQNEDRCAFISFPAEAGRRAPFLAFVVDGMGGMEGGTEAAGITAFALTRGAIVSGCRAGGWLVEAAEQANTQIYNLLRGQGGAVFAAVFSDGENIWVAHAGDARVYGRQGGQHVRQLTTDHVTPGGGILNYVGMGPDFEVIETRIRPEVESLLITTDGALIGTEDSLPRLWRGTKASDLVHRLIEISLWLGGEDNASSICISPDKIETSPDNVCIWTSQLRPLPIPYQQSSPRQPGKTNNKMPGQKVPKSAAGKSVRQQPLDVSRRDTPLFDSSRTQPPLIITSVDVPAAADVADVEAVQATSEPERSP